MYCDSCFALTGPQIKGTEEDWKTVLETKRGSSVKNLISIKTGEKRIRSENPDQELEKDGKDKTKKKKKFKK